MPKPTFTVINMNPLDRPPPLPIVCVVCAKLKNELICQKLTKHHKPPSLHTLLEFFGQIRCAVAHAWEGGIQFVNNCEMVTYFLLSCVLNP